MKARFLLVFIVFGALGVAVAAALRYLGLVTASSPLGMIWAFITIVGTVRYIRSDLDRK
ncbi:hypothetical protein ACFVVU_09010 [Kitasatospora sp. NPDC057965]|uniref:hypothetical protein n=1 Tax=Kitasatospora sp. NPDC057965 TaxID=3346291 RepID=UPI0036D95365